MQYEYTTRGWQRDHCAARAVSDADDVQLRSAVFEKLPHRGPETAAVPQAAKSTLKLCKAVDKCRCIEGTAESTTDERGCGFSSDVDRQVHRRDFGDRYALVAGI
jgi:hypothetical protein